MRPWGGKSKAEGPTGGTGESLRGAGVARLAIGGRRATWLREARNRPRKRYGPIFSQPPSHMVTSPATGATWHVNKLTSRRTSQRIAATRVTIPDRAQCNMVTWSLLVSSYRLDRRGSSARYAGLSADQAMVEKPSRPPLHTAPHPARQTSGRPGRR